MYPGTHAATAPDRPAVIMAGVEATVTYAELDETPPGSRRRCTTSAFVRVTSSRC